MVAAVTLAVTAVAISGCVGAISRDEFRAEVSRRALVGSEPTGEVGEVGEAGEVGAGSVTGPAGIAGAFPERAVAQVLDRLGADDLEVSTMSFDLDTLIGTIEARDPARPDEVDMFLFADALLAAVDPVQLSPSARDRFDEMAFRVSEVRFDQLDDALQIALDSFGDDDGRVTTLTWMAFLPGRPQLTVRVANERRSETIRFDLDGQVTEDL